MKNKFFQILTIIIAIILGTIALIGGWRNLVELKKSITINGTVVKNGWEKSFNSYCAQGSNYFTLSTNEKEFILEFEPKYSENQMSEFSGKHVIVTGINKTKKINCPPNSQCPVIPGGGPFLCEVFTVKDIFFSDSVIK